MLVLGRKEGETILLDGGIRIVVVACDKGGVRLGIEAPADCKILRGEIADAVRLENRRAAVPAGAMPLLGAFTARPPAPTAPASGDAAAGTPSAPQPLPPASADADGAGA